MNWNDLKIFLAIARSGSLRKAATVTQSSISTVSRRIEILESDLGIKIFTRRPEGYLLTKAGSELMNEIVTLEAQASMIENKASRLSNQPEGSVHLTVPDAVFTYLLTEEFKFFKQNFSNIHLHITSTYTHLDIIRGEADIALRCTNTPDDRLVGKKLSSFYNNYYASKEYLLEFDLSDPNCGAQWLGQGNSQRFQEWIASSPYPHFPVSWEIPNYPAQVAACKSSLGMAVLPCFIGDQEPSLVRLTQTAFSSLETWLLVHPELKNLERVKTIFNFLEQVLTKRKNLLRGYQVET